MIVKDTIQELHKKQKRKTVLFNPFSEIEDYKKQKRKTVLFDPPILKETYEE